MKIQSKHDLKVEQVPLATLRPYPGNARCHSKKQIQKLATQIRGVGWINPIISDETGMILSGHARYESALFAGLSDVPVIKISGLTDAQKRSHILADNRIADESHFSKDLLKIELESLLQLGDGLHLTGFDSIEIDTLLALDPVDPDNDNVHLPEEKLAPVSQLGDLWHIGEHRILNGDARDPQAYERLLAGQRAQQVLTDPPYGCPIAGFVSGLGKVKHADFKMGAGEETLAEFARNLLRPAFRLMAAHSDPGAIGYIFSDWRAAPHVDDAALGVFAEKKNLAVWGKTNSGMGSFLRSAHELVHIYKLNKGKHINNIGLTRGRSNLWIYAGANVFRKGRLQDLADHATVKPRKLCEDAIIDTSYRGGLILDAFAGSGTTLAAAHMVGRRGYGIELDEQYVDVILRRLSEVVGEPPLLNGETPLAEVARARLAERSGDEP